MVPEYMHFLLAVSFAYAFYLISSHLKNFIFNRMAIWLMDVAPQVNRRGRRITEEHRARRIEKCVESMWKLTYFIIMEICFLIIMYNEPWLRVSAEYIKGWPNHELKLSMMIYYMSQCGFYMYSIVSSIFLETRRRDFRVMMIHHILALFLVAFSYITGFFRIGSAILGLHNISDILMEASKTLMYANKKQAAAWMFFSLFWFLGRLIIFPLLGIKAPSDDFLMRDLDIYQKSQYDFFNTMLLTLLVFQFFRWCFMNVSMSRLYAGYEED